MKQSNATTSYKNVETRRRKFDLFCFKSQLLTGLWDVTLTSLPPPIQSCSSKFLARSCITSNFDKGWRGDHKHKIMDRPYKAKYSRVSQVLLLLVVALFHEYFNASHWKISLLPCTQNTVTWAWHTLHDCMHWEHWFTCGSSTVVLFCRVRKWNCNMCGIVSNSSFNSF